tara:strand:+ start:207 stop:755 length:549 start_codon:yes stop_codon:yes gene_type:complete
MKWKSNMENNNNTVIISGNCKWACLNEPNTTYAPVWSIQVLVDDNNRSVIENGFYDENDGNYYPIPISTNKDGEEVVTIKRKVDKADGSKRNAPFVKDSQNNPWDKNTMIGNGSSVNVMARTWRWNHQQGKRFTTGISADCVGVQVVDLVPYNSAGATDFEVVPGGYVANTSTLDEDIPFAS